MSGIKDMQIIFDFLDKDWDADYLLKIRKKVEDKIHIYNQSNLYLS